MKIKRNLLFLFAITICSFSQIAAQNVFDALRYSSFEAGSTARSIGVNGSMGALGADFSVLSSNPAGLAMFRRSEMMFTPSVVNANVDAQLSNDPDAGFLSEGRTSFNLNNFGIVVAAVPSSPNWRTFNFGIGYNRLANFKRDIFFEGRSAGSITDRFQELINTSGSFDDFETGVAFDAEALFDLEGDGIYETDYGFFQGVPLLKNQFIEESGSINELVFSFAGNYEERFMIGFTLGVPFLSFTQTKTYEELDDGPGVEGDIDFFEDLRYTEELTTTGVGLNLKLGFIYRLNQMLRFGLAVHSPTAYRLEDNFTTEMDYSFLNGSVIVEGNAASPDGFFDYKLRSPWRFMGSAGILLQKRGFISAEIEWVDYSGANFRYDGFPDDERDVNSDISGALQSSLNIRLGAELAMDIFRLRGGFGILPSPVVDDDTIYNTISLGVGLRQEYYFVDLAYRRNNNNSTYRPYLVTNAPEQVVNLEESNNKFYVTFGFKF